MQRAPSTPLAAALGTELAPPAAAPAPALDFSIHSQPDDETCGPTCLTAVYHYFHDPLPFAQVSQEIPRLRDGGTLACLLACHALQRGYRARLYTYDMKTFDPTWLVGRHERLPQKLRQQMDVKADPKLHHVSQAYLRYLELGGEIKFEDLSRALIRRPLLKGLPIIAGLSSTYLYREMRDVPSTNETDDLRGLPGGHFVVLHGYRPLHGGTVLVADPYGNNPLTGSNEYEIPIDRVICAILLGIVTYDANLLILEPRRSAKKKNPV